jgi:RHS repeat-associated protein
MPTTHFIWDSLDDNLLMEKDGNGNTLAEYTHEPGLHGQLISQRRNGQTYYHHYDGQGNTCAVTDQNGNIVETATYSAFGEVVEKTSSIVNPFGFKGALGYYANPESNDLQFERRVYRPEIGRWMSFDPPAFSYVMKVLQNHIDGKSPTRVLTDQNRNVTDTYAYDALGMEASRLQVFLAFPLPPIIPVDEPCRMVDAYQLKGPDEKLPCKPGYEKHGVFFVFCIKCTGGCLLSPPTRNPFPPPDAPPPRLSGYCYERRCYATSKVDLRRGEVKPNCECMWVADL